MTNRELERLIAAALADPEMRARLRHPASQTVPMSPEVRQHAQDMEAVELANSWMVAVVTPAPRPWWDRLLSALALVGLFLVIAVVVAGLIGWGA